MERQAPTPFNPSRSHADHPSLPRDSLSEVKAKLFRLLNRLCNRFPLYWHFGCLSVFHCPLLPVSAFLCQPGRHVPHIGPHYSVAYMVDERMRPTVSRYGGDISSVHLLRVYLNHRLLRKVVVGLIGPFFTRVPNDVHGHRLPATLCAVGAAACPAGLTSQALTSLNHRPLYSCASISNDTFTS